MPSKYQIQKLKDFEKANEYLSRALALLDGNQSYVLNLTHYKQLVSIKLKLENLIKGTKADFIWAEKRIKNE
jgi:hypothetical protein